MCLPEIRAYRSLITGVIPAPPGHVRVAGRTLYVARSSDVPPRHVICGLAMTDQPLSPRLLPRHRQRGPRARGGGWSAA